MNNPICLGTLLWFDVAGNERFDPSALVVCGDCGAIFVSGGLLDDRHRDAQVVRAE